MGRAVGLWCKARTHSSDETFQPILMHRRQEKREANPPTESVGTIPSSAGRFLGAISSSGRGYYIIRTATIELGRSDPVPKVLFARSLTRLSV